MARVDEALGALPEGRAAVMLRAKKLGAAALFEAATALVAVTRARGAKLIVNDRADVALAVGADGVHLPSRGIPVKQARRWLGGRLIGASTHSMEEAQMAWRGGADYVVYGPVWATDGKGPAVGIEALAAMVRAAPVPVFALGGVDADRARQCVAVGARVACIGAVLGRRDAAAGARALGAAIG
ncbi:MAG: Thiamin-phosphate pyrophosphorylase [Myxococcales bacterium]|nr:Thiamin-phosphate pyrophosphorylase [Myxococcales bacterium]